MIEYRYTRAKGENSLGADDQGKLSGRAAPFNSETSIGGDKWGFREKIAPGAFKKSISERDIVLLDNHDSGKPLARTSSGTLNLKETKGGLDFDATPSDTSYGRDAKINARDRNYGGCSFGFEIVRDSWERGQDGAPDLRTLEEVKLHEISVVTFPAYGDTNVKARDSIAAARESREAALGPIEGADSKRSAKADYSDLSTCGDCGATGQYGKHCGSCGKPMGQGEDPNDYCTHCGAKMKKGDRASHECEESRASSKPYGNVAYADPKNGKYPIDTAEHAKAAWAYINQEKNAAKYPLNGVSLASVKAKIKAACKKFGIKVDESNALDFELAELRTLVDEALTYEFNNVQIRETFEIVRDFLARDDANPYDDSFYERDTDDGNKSDASDSDAGDKPCAACDDTGKDKSGNKCAVCGGSKAKNGDGKNHESGPGNEDKDGKQPSNQKKNSSEPDLSTRTDDQLREHFENVRMRERMDAARQMHEAANRDESANNNDKGDSNG